MGSKGHARADCARGDAWLLREIEQREVSKMLLFEPSNDIRELPQYFCPTCRCEITQQASCPAERDFIPHYCSNCGQKLKAYVTGTHDCSDDLFFADTVFVPILKGDDVSVSKETDGAILSAASVDAIDEGIVRIVYNLSGQTASLPLAALPDGIREGDMIYQQNGVWQLDAAGGAAKREELKGRLNRLVDRGKTKP